MKYIFIVVAVCLHVSSPVERIDASQLGVISKTDAEASRERERAAEAARRERDVASRAVADRASEAMVAQSTEPCPRCGAPSGKHINKCRCGFEYCWDCGKVGSVGTSGSRAQRVERSG